MTAPTRTWTRLPSPTLARHGLAVAGKGNTVHAMGGSTAPGHISSADTVDALTFSHAGRSLSSSRLRTMRWTGQGDVRRL